MWPWNKQPNNFKTCIVAPEGKLCTIIESSKVDKNVQIEFKQL